ncbi:outer membrane protein assembly factor BamA [Chitinilyticum piscinae]|uniref:Outer membrane protein assembly factor BamA n=1 Tax=Chitinilyticum piscinae TaxID=2866724 RepID=A0A8J7K213_9NEIS|nr:outer membrane protein assembly factor BamA [Chitinilyticum piscinae]MBE9609397.1 outer membrane protein assembly factor BamA [Chitinilyticum piscinae]
MKFKPMFVLLMAALGTPAAYAFDAFTVSDIKVEGLQRTDPGTVFNYLPVRVGETFDEGKAKDSIKALFGTGFFNDVRIETDKDTIIITVEERPTVAQINVNGAKLLEKDQIKTALKGQNLAEGRIFQRDTLDAAVNELKQQYYARGRYSVIITPTVTKLDRNRVGIELDISEGDVARIKQINIVGNKAFSEGDLLDEMSQTTSGWMTWYSRSDQYSKQKMAADLEKLKSFYMDRGYLDFAIVSTQVALSDDKTEMFLTVNIKEGERYQVSGVKLAGDYLLPESEMLPLVAVKSGEIFSRTKVSQTVSQLSQKLGENGYAFANINPVPEVDKEKHTVAFTFFVDPGKKTYVRSINVSGNTLTKDEVIRRELRQIESAQYDLAKIKRSKERLQQLDYFSEVNLDTAAVPDAVDQVDLNVRVAEKKTGNFNIGAGYGQDEGFIIMASLSQANFLGSGKKVTIEANTSQTNQVYSFNVNNPYFTPDGVSFGWGVFSKKSDPSANDLEQGDYQTNSLGGGLSFGFPVSDYNNLQFRLDYEDLTLITNSKTPKYIQDFVGRWGEDSQEYTASLTFASDTRDSATYATKGNLFKASLMAAIPGSEIEYYKASLQNRFFASPVDDLTFMWNFEIGYGDGYGNGELPFYKNFFAGGVSSVRGYKSGSLGPRDENNDSMGGNRRFVNNFEILTPVPGIKDDKSMRLSAFIDAGAIYGAGEKLDTEAIRYSAGVGFTWMSPIGPIKLIYAQPLNDKENDKVENFQFQLGQVF